MFLFAERTGSQVLFDKNTDYANFDKQMGNKLKPKFYRTKHIKQNFKPRKIKSRRILRSAKSTRKNYSFCLFKCFFHSPFNQSKIFL